VLSIVGEVSLMERNIQLFTLPQEINDSVYTSSKYPLLVDPSGQAIQFLKYRARYLSIYKPGDFEKESLRRAVTQGLHNGAWLVLDFGELECDLQSYFDKDFFPETVLSPLDLFVEENYKPLLRQSDEFTAKVTYEHQEALANGAFQDRTKCHAPERVADVDKRFIPKDAFRLIVASKREEPPADLVDKFVVLKLQVSEQQMKENAGVWAGREKPRETKSKEQLKMDSDLLELAFDGELEEIKPLLEKGSDLMAKDGRGHCALSEAAVQGHLETVRYILDWRAPIGCDPNAQGSDGRTALHRAAFQGHSEVVQLLLERGADPRLKDRQGETPFDMASNDESRQPLTSWNVETTDKLKEERQKALDIEDEKNVRNEEERLALVKRKKTDKLIEYAEAGDKEMLELELNDIEDQRQIPTSRDDRGNNVLHVAAQHGRLEIAVALIQDFGIDVNCREAKGWTPIAIAAFKGHKKLCQALMELKASPEIPNAYRKDAFAVAQDDEIRETLKACLDGARSGSAMAAAAPAASAKEGKPAGKAKGKAKGKAGAGGPPAAAAGSGAAAAKALAKGKAKAKGKKK